MAFQIVDILTNLGTATVNFLPNLLMAIILLFIGLVVGKIVGRVVKEVLDKIRIDYYVTETHKPAISLSGLFALTIRWWIYVAFIAAALSREVLGLPVLAEWVRDITLFIPNVIGAAIIMVVGYVLAEYIKAQLKKTDSLYANVVSKVLFFLILYVTIALALDSLRVSTVLINNILLVIIASVGLGVAIAMGLGLKDAISDLSKRYVKKMKV